MKQRSSEKWDRLLVFGVLVGFSKLQADLDHFEY